MKLILRIREYTDQHPTVPITPPCDVWLIETQGGAESCLLWGRMFKPDAERLVARLAGKKRMGETVVVQRETRRALNLTPDGKLVTA